LPEAETKIQRAIIILERKQAKLNEMANRSKVAAKQEASANAKKKKKRRNSDEVTLSSLSQDSILSLEVKKQLKSTTIGPFSLVSEFTPGYLANQKQKLTKRIVEAKL